MTAILRDASGKMHHGILFDRRLRQNKPFPLLYLGNAQKKKKNCRFISQRSKYFNLQAHDLVLLTTIGMM